MDYQEFGVSSHSALRRQHPLCELAEVLLHQPNSLSPADSERGSRGARRLDAARLPRTSTNGCEFYERRAAGDNLQATELVHEVYLRLIDVQNVNRMGKALFLRDLRSDDAPDSGGRGA